MTRKMQKWEGGVRPVAAIAWVDLDFRSGTKVADATAGNWPWEHTGGGNDIVAWRVSDRQDYEALATSLDAQDALIAELVGALEPFAKAGELFPVPAPYGPALIYGPAAGADYEIHSDHLRAASAALAKAREAKG